MLLQAILIGLVAMCSTFEWALGTCLASRPIVTGVFIGLVMGDLETGIIVGATLEMVFIGSVTIGAAVPPDVITGGILGTAFAISTGQGAEIALTLAFPIASLYLIVDNALTLLVLPIFVHKADDCVEREILPEWSACILSVASWLNLFPVSSFVRWHSISVRRL